METHVAFSRGPGRGIRVILNPETLTIFWEAKNYSKLGSWQRTFDSIDEFHAFEADMEQWLRSNQFELGDIDTNGS